DARKHVEDNIPPEKEIARLRNEVKLLEKDKMAVINQLARERVAVNELQKDVNLRADKQTEHKNQLTDEAKAIKEATHVVTVGHRKVSVDEAKANLETKVKHYVDQQKTLDKMNATLATRIKVRDSLEQQLETLKTQEKELVSAIDGLEAELNNLKLQQMQS